MFKRAQSLVLWILLGLFIIVLPIACGSSSSPEDAGSNLEPSADAMTPG
jgi:hypothetical protein